MLTKGGRIIMSNVFGDTGKVIPIVSASSITKTTFKAKDTSGDEYYFIPKGGYYLDQLRLSMTDGNGGQAFGTGDTPASEDDYTLESVITSGLSASAPSVTTEYDSENNCYFRRMTYTINNTSDADITIKEVGTYRGIAYASTLGATGSSTKLLLVDRTVLDTPLTIPAGEAGVLRYDFVFPGDDPEPEGE